MNGDQFRWPTTALPVVTTAGRFALSDRAFETAYRSRTHALHVHDYDGVLQLAGRSITLRPGDATISPAGAISAYALPAAGTHWCAHFEPARSSHGPSATLPLHLPLGGLGDHAGEKIMAVAQRLAGGTDAIAAASASAAMLELLLWLSLQSRVVRTASASRGAGAVERAAALIHERMADDLCIEDLAAEVKLTQNYLARLFRRRYGVTMPHFLLTRRMDAARHLLLHTALPIAQVGKNVGLPDPQHFNKQFRRVVGVSPSTYRSAAPRSYRT